MQQFFQTKPIQICGLPIGIVCCSDASIGFLSGGKFTIIDKTDKYNAIYTEEGITVNGEVYEYGARYNYKEIPNLLAWLTAQNMINPMQGEN